MAELSFAGRVAIITGAGGALGRAYALLLASRGASIVVNDLGVPMSGSGVSAGPAQKVVAEIKAAGGKAIANSDSVMDGEKIVKAAIEAFGRVDIVINNAGILRDVSFAKMSQEQWTLIQQIHVEGAFRVTKAAWPFMMKQKYGRVIMTSSAAGLYGNVGQANYSAAKLALVGFAATLAKEGQKNNVLVNSIAPIAGSRMTETVLPADLVAALDPKYVAPVVAYLCHESSTTNGGVFESGAGYCAQVHFQRSAGVHFPLPQQGGGSQAFTPEVIAASWDKINDFSKGATYPQGLNDTMNEIMSGLGGDLAAGGSNLGKGKPQLSAQGANGSTSAAAAAASSSSSSSSAAAFKSDPVFAELSSVIASDPSVTKLNGIFVYNLSAGPSGATKTVTVSLKKDSGASLYEGPPRDGKKADVTIDVSDADYVDLALGKASAQMLYMKGKLKMKGNMSMAMKFDSTIKTARAALKAAQQPKSKL